MADDASNRRLSDFPCPTTEHSAEIVSLLKQDQDMTHDNQTPRFFKLSPQSQEETAGTEMGLADSTCPVGKEALLDLKKKQLLDQVEAILAPPPPIHCLKIQVIDETALIESATDFLGTPEKPEKSKASNAGFKLTYSRMEMEALRFVKLAEQKKLWKKVYNGLGPEFAREYDKLANSTQHHIKTNSNNRKRSRKMNQAPSILEESLGNLVNSEIRDVSLHDPACSYSVTNKDGYPVPEPEFSEDDDSDEEYGSIQRPAFLVEGEPNFDSGSPEDGFEYLRRVRWEAAQIPKVRVAKVDKSKFIKRQSDYMPKIPEIAKCPQQLLPLKQWEDEFLFEFSELRLALSHVEGSKVNTFKDSQSKVVSERCSSQEPPLDNIFEEILNVKPVEIDCSIVRNCYDQSAKVAAEGCSSSALVENLSRKVSVDYSSNDSPSLSVILRLDSVARVSMLRKRVKAAEERSTLSRDECLWLFALCAVVDTPLDADTSASMRSLLRKCAALRATKSTIDDELVMLNILATVAGRYFGQSEN